jgi:DNA repair photolyase
MKQLIGITERGDAALDTSWLDWVNKGKPAILITKNPGKLFEHLESHMNVIVHATITGHGGTVLEPNVPNYLESLSSLLGIIAKIGLERIVLRVDPIILTEKGKEVAKLVITTGRWFGIKRIRISFLDNYEHVKERFKQANIPMLPYDFHAPLNERTAFWEEVGKPEICGEPFMSCTGCVSQLDLDTFGISVEETKQGQQRGTCCCLALKHELLTNKTRCAHKCAYCYWKD